MKRRGRRKRKRGRVLVWVMFGDELGFWAQRNCICDVLFGLVVYGCKGVSAIYRSREGVI